MLTIHKFPLPYQPVTVLEMPAGARILSCHVQHGAATLWALVDPAAPLIHRQFRAVLTGSPESDGLRDWTYIGTLLFDQGSFVLHVFEVPV